MTYIEHWSNFKSSRGRRDMLENQESRMRELPPPKHPRYQETARFGASSFRTSGEIGSNITPSKRSVDMGRAQDLVWNDLCKVCDLRHYLIKVSRDFPGVQSVIKIILEVMIKASIVIHMVKLTT